VSHMRGRSRDVAERHSGSISRGAKNATKERFCTSGDCQTEIVNRVRGGTVEPGRGATAGPDYS